MKKGECRDKMSWIALGDRLMVRTASLRDGTFPLASEVFVFS
jgi:hypothetical protein